MATWSRPARFRQRRLRRSRQENHCWSTVRSRADFMDIDAVSMGSFSDGKPRHLYEVILQLWRTVRLEASVDGHWSNMAAMTPALNQSFKGWLAGPNEPYSRGLRLKRGAGGWSRQLKMSWRQRAPLPLVVLSALLRFQDRMVSERSTTEFAPRPRIATEEPMAKMTRMGNVQPVIRLMMKQIAIEIARSIEAQYQTRLRQGLLALAQARLGRDQQQQTANEKYGDALAASGASGLQSFGARLRAARSAHAVDNRSAEARYQLARVATEQGLATHRQEQDAGHAMSKRLLAGRYA